MISAVMPTYGRIDIAFDRGEGAYLFTADGTRYLDFTSGIGVVSLGHAHPKLAAVVAAQAAKLWHTSNMFHIPGQERLAERLVANTFADTVFFTNSGAEAVECGIKTVRAHFDAVGDPGRYRIICANQAFHGRTLATISAGGQDKLLKGFEPAVDGFDHVGFGNLNETRAAITDQTAAILIEPIQGEGGIRPAAEDYLHGLREIADEYGLLLFFDEVQCGMGRTGKLFAHEWAGVAPDVMAVAKGIGSGFPVGCCLATEHAAKGMVAGTHGSTYGGNPLAMAVGNAVLDVILENGFLEHVVAMGARLMSGLEAIVAAHPAVLAEARGRGLMVGLACTDDPKPLIAKLRENRLLTVAGGGNVVRLLPPLISGETEIDAALEIIDDSCTQLGKLGEGT
ncbi:MAG: aspartate aminotransferase family protein [Alphaproteobacteria bacterium]|nr:aspartate aminotransferase family protein [Alphaproteobacteria bacterium]